MLQQEIFNQQRDIHIFREMRIFKLFSDVYCIFMSNKSHYIAICFINFYFYTRKQLFPLILNSIGTVCFPSWLYNLALQGFNFRLFSHLRFSFSSPVSAWFSCWSVPKGGNGITTHIGTMYNILQNIFFK